MFSITAWNCATGYFTFGHEVGHNLGMSHDRGTSNRCNGKNFNYGYRDPEARFRSILGYGCRSGQCDRNPANRACTRVQRFSNTKYMYNGRPIGTASEDNTRVVNEAKADVAQYFRHVSPQSFRFPTVIPSSTPSRDLAIYGPSESPTRPPSPQPSSIPSTRPSLKVSRNPSDPPTSDGCFDSPLDFIIDKKEIVNCEWVSNDKKDRCDTKGVNKSCPLTCDNCMTCSDSSLKFIITAPKSQNRKCRDIGKKEGVSCDVPFIRSTCRNACGVC